MKSKWLVVVFVSGISGLLAAADPILAANVKWTAPFATHEAAPKTLLCVMTRGFFRAPTRPDMAELIATWIREHPKAILIPVARFGPVIDGVPDSEMVFVWIVDGECNLNLELVEKGCFTPQTQIMAKGQKLEAPQADYDAFVRRALEAGEAAKEKNVGIWKNAPQ